MNTKQGFIVLVSVLFLAVSIVGAQAGTTVKGSKSNSDNIVTTPSTGDTGTLLRIQPITIRSSKSNASFRKAVKDPKGEPAEATTVKSSKSNSSERNSSTTSGAGNPSPNDAITIRSSKSNCFIQEGGQGP